MVATKTGPLLVQPKGNPISSSSSSRRLASKQQQQQRVAASSSSSSKIPRFKTSANSSIKDVAEIRRLLALERASHTELRELLEFWAADYERMMVDDWLVSRFLLRGQKLAAAAAVNGSSDLYSATIELIRDCAKFRHQYRINGLTGASEFPADWLKVDGIISHKTDRAGNPSIYLRAKLHRMKLIDTIELRHQFKRMLLYYLETCDRQLINNPGRGICCVFDMSRATFDNLDVELVFWMFKSFKSHGPKLLAYIIVYNIPWFLNATLKLLFGTILARSNQHKIKFVYGREILDYIDQKSLPPYLREQLGAAN